MILHVDSDCFCCRNDRPDTLKALMTATYWKIARVVNKTCISVVISKCIDFKLTGGYLVIWVSRENNGGTQTIEIRWLSYVFWFWCLLITNLNLLVMNQIKYNGWNILHYWPIFSSSLLPLIFLKFINFFFTVTSNYLNLK